jgi:hypothetical protein
MIDIRREIVPLTTTLESHPVYSSVTDQKSLKVFMENHVYSVWDFMSLVKFLQNEFAPSTFPWTPPKNMNLVRFLNEIVLGEESDSDNDGSHTSHFELYCMAMKEIKADSRPVKSFIETVQKHDLKTAFQSNEIPHSAKEFMAQTFSFIASGKPHVVASAFAFGRETVIPMMFQELINKMNISKEEAPTFHYYLERHIELDGDEHGPLALEIIASLCGDNPTYWNEALHAAQDAIKARLSFWDQVELSIKHNTLSIQQSL